MNAPESLPGPENLPPARETLPARPGWAELCTASAELHAAEVLLGDPVASPATAVVHVERFWAAMHVAGCRAGLGELDAQTPEEWLGTEIRGVDNRVRSQLRRQLEQLSESSKPGTLREHVSLARELYTVVEPVVGGVPLRRRRLRVLWGVVGLVVLFGPVLGYVALNREVEGEGPWRATYYTDRELDKELTVLRELEVDHNWEKGPPLEAVPPDKFSVRWDTCMHIDEAGPVVFQVNANDGARVFVDGEPVIEAWDRHPKTRKRGHGSGEVELEAGVHHLRVEYFESMGVASIRLSASLAGEVPAPLANDLLSYPGDRLDDEDPCAAARGTSDANE